PSVAAYLSLSITSLPSLRTSSGTSSPLTTTLLIDHAPCSALRSSLAASFFASSAQAKTLAATMQAPNVLIAMLRKMEEKYHSPVYRIHAHKTANFPKRTTRQAAPHGESRGRAERRASRVAERSTRDHDAAMQDRAIEDERRGVR